MIHPHVYYEYVPPSLNIYSRQEVLRQFRPIAKITRAILTHIGSFCILGPIKKVVEVARSLFCSSVASKVIAKELKYNERIWHVINTPCSLYKLPLPIAPKIDSLCRGTVVDICGEENNYYKVKTDTQHGFIKAHKVSTLAVANPRKSLLATTASKASIVYLKGTCSSGKTSLAKSYSKAEGWVTIDDDIICMKEYVDAWRTSYPTEMKCIEEAMDQKNIYMAIKKNLFCFNVSSSEENNNRAKKAIETIQTNYRSTFIQWRTTPHKKIQEAIQKQIQQALAEEKNILLDSWFYTAEEIEKLFPDIRVITMMIFSPLEICLQRLEERNTSSDAQRDFQEKRFKANVLNSFFNLYTLSDNPYGSVGFVDRKGMHSLFSSIATSLPTAHSSINSPIERELSKEDFLHRVNSFAKLFTETDHDTLYLVPKLPQDFTVNSSHQNPKQLASFTKEAISSLLDRRC